MKQPKYKKLNLSSQLDILNKTNVSIIENLLAMRMLPITLVYNMIIQNCIEVQLTKRKAKSSSLVDKKNKDWIEKNLQFTGC